MRATKQLHTYFPLCLLFVAAVAFADESTERRLAEELLNLTQMDTSVERTAQQMSELMVSELAQLPVARQHKEQSKPYLERVRLLILASMTWENLRDEYVAAYTDAFTEAELTALVEFFRTNEGRHYIAELGNLQHRVLDINARHAKSMAPAISAITKEMQTKLGSQPPTP